MPDPIDMVKAIAREIRDYPAGVEVEQAAQAAKRARTTAMADPNFAEGTETRRLSAPSYRSRQLGKETGGESIVGIENIFSTQKQISDYMMAQNKELAEFIDVDSLRSSGEYWNLYEKQLKSINQELDNAGKKSGISFEFVLDSSASRSQIADAVQSGGENALSGHTFALSLRGKDVSGKTLGEIRVPFITGPYGTYGRGMSISPIGGIVATAGLEGFPMAAGGAAGYSALMPYNQAVGAQIFKAIKSGKWREGAVSPSGRFGMLESQLEKVFTNFYAPARQRLRQLSDVIQDPEQALHAARIMIEGIQTLDEANETQIRYQPLINMFGEQMQDPGSALYRSKLISDFSRQELDLYKDILVERGGRKVLTSKAGLSQEAASLWETAVASKVHNLLSGSTAPIMFRDEQGVQMSIQKAFNTSATNLDSSTVAKAYANTASWTLDKATVGAIESAQRAGISIMVPGEGDMTAKGGRRLLSALKRNAKGQVAPTLKARAAMMIGGYQGEFVDYLVSKATGDQRIGKRWGFVRSGRDIGFTQMRVGTLQSEYGKWLKATGKAGLDPDATLGALGQISHMGKASGISEWASDLNIEDIGKYSETHWRWGKLTEEDLIYKKGDELFGKGRMVKKGDILAQIRSPLTGDITDIVAQESGFAGFKFTQGTAGEELKLTIGAFDNLKVQPSIVADEFKTTTTTPIKFREAFEKHRRRLESLIEQDKDSLWRKTGQEGGMWKPALYAHIRELKDAEARKGVFFTQTMATAADVGGLEGDTRHTYIAAHSAMMDLRARSGIHKIERKIKVPGGYKSAKDYFRETYRRATGMDRRDMPFHPNQWLDKFGTNARQELLNVTQNMDASVRFPLIEAFDMWRTEMSGQASMPKYKPARTTFRDMLMATGRSFGSEGGLSMYMWRQKQLRQAIEKGADAKYLRGALAQVDVALPFFQSDYLEGLKQGGKIMDIRVGQGKRGETIDAMYNLSKFFEVHQPGSPDASPTTQIAAFKKAARFLGRSETLNNIDADQFGFMLHFDDRRIFNKDFIEKLVGGDDAFWTPTRATMLQNIMDYGLKFSSNESFGYSLEAGSFGVQALKTRQKIFDKATAFSELLMNAKANEGRLLEGAKALVEEVHTQAKTVIGNLAGKGGTISKALTIEEPGSVPLPTQSSYHTQRVRADVAKYINQTASMRQMGKNASPVPNRYLKQAATTIYMNPEDIAEFARGKPGMDTSEMFAMYRRWPDLSSTNQMVFRIAADEDVARGKVSIADLPLELAKGDFDYDMANVTLLDTGSNMPDEVRNMIRAAYRNTQNEVMGAMEYYATGHRTLQAYRNLGKDVERKDMINLITSVENLDTRWKNMSKAEQRGKKGQIVYRALERQRKKFATKYGVNAKDWAGVLKGQLEYGVETGKASNLGARILASVTGEAVEQGLLVNDTALNSKIYGAGKRRFQSKELLPQLYDLMSFTLSEARIREFKAGGLANAARAQGMYDILVGMEKGKVLESRKTLNEVFKGSVGKQITDKTVQEAARHDPNLAKRIEGHVGRYMLDIGDQAVANQTFLGLVDESIKNKEGLYLLDDDRFDAMTHFLEDILSTHREKNIAQVGREGIRLPELYNKLVDILISGKEGQEEYLAETLHAVNRYIKTNNLEGRIQEGTLPALDAINAVTGMKAGDADINRKGFMGKYSLMEGPDKIDKEAADAAAKLGEKISKETKTSSLVDHILERSLVPESKGFMAGMIAFAGGAVVGGMFGDSGELLPPTPIQEGDPMTRQGAITAPPAYLRQQSAIGSRMVVNGSSSNVPSVVSAMNGAGMGGSISVHDNMSSDIGFMYNHHQSMTGRF